MDQLEKRKIRFAMGMVRSTILDMGHLYRRNFYPAYQEYGLG